MNLAGRRLAQIALTTRDLERAKTFYRDTLGLPLLFEVGDMLFFQLEQQRLLIGLSPSQPVGGAVLYFDAPDIEPLAVALAAKGVRFMSESRVLQRSASGELRLREFLDPDGNPLALLGWVANTAPG